MIIARSFFSLLASLGLVACAGSGEGPAAGAGAVDPVAGNAMKTGDWFDDDRDKIVDKYGAMNPKMRSDGQLAAAGGQEFAGFKRDNPEFKGRWEGKKFEAGDYRKKSWWGEKDYVKKVFGGKSETPALSAESSFGSQRAKESGTGSRLSGKKYGRTQYQTGAAREAGAAVIDRPSDAETDERRAIFSEPDIIPWQEQHGMTIEDTRRALGR
ncbi:MAG: hypothetical protein EAZ84_03830 [Verrucomicrobia bacterium]|nr:MAG: hypothetical protein EAZ84_03830 [Verrucomicrobiota bacterium]TAF24241.1 MAG: hypothetical protein EAZ71_11770 [Verrucomicrobiota bacterium]